MKQGRWIKLSTTLIEILNMFKVDESIRESVREHDGESLSSHKPALINILNMLKVNESGRELAVKRE